MNGMLFNFVAETFHLDCRIPSTPIPASTPKGGDGKYQITWEISVDGQNWATAPGKYNKEDYIPVDSTHTAWYRRIVTSDVLSDTSNTVHVVITGQIKNNLIATDQEICLGESIEPIIHSGEVLSGGTGEYSYIWQYLADTVWHTDPGADSLPSYQPVDLQNSMDYRRIVLSGQCRDTSSSVSIVVHELPVIITQPADVNTLEGTEARFSLAAESTQSLNYSWMHRDSLTGTNTNILVLDSVGAEDQGSVYCIVDNSFCSSISRIAFLSVEPEQQITGSQDIMADRVNIYPNPADEQVFINLPAVGLDIKIYSLSGRLHRYVRNQNVLDLRTLHPGDYILILSHPELKETVSRKIIISR
jgi:hypothetical protein